MTHTIYYRESKTKGKIGCPATAVNTVKHRIGVVNCNYCFSPPNQNYFLISRWFINRHHHPSPTRIAITTLLPLPWVITLSLRYFFGFYKEMSEAPPHPAERKPPLSQEWQPSLSKSLLQLAVLAVTARRVVQVTVEAILLRRCQYRSKSSSGKELNLTQLLLQSDITCIGWSAHVPCCWLTWMSCLLISRQRH